jgi:K+-sensing histidine kinase KdpD
MTSSAGRESSCSIASADVSTPSCAKITTVSAKGVTSRVMVCLSSRSPNPDALLRKAACLADRLNAPFYAVYIQTRQESMERVEASLQRQVANTLALANRFGGVAMALHGTEVVGTIAAFAKVYGMTHVLLGCSHRPCIAKDSWESACVRNSAGRADHGHRIRRSTYYSETFRSNAAKNAGDWRESRSPR